MCPAAAWLLCFWDTQWVTLAQLPTHSWGKGSPVHQPSPARSTERTGWESPQVREHWAVLRAGLGAGSQLPREHLRLPGHLGKSFSLTDCSMTLRTIPSWLWALKLGRRQPSGMGSGLGAGAWVQTQIQAFWHRGLGKA